MTGENALALDQLEMLSTIPGDFHFGGLLVELDWVPIRREPEFRTLLAQMAPKPIRSTADVGDRHELPNKMIGN